MIKDVDYLFKLIVLKYFKNKINVLYLFILFKHLKQLS